jgi:hypothetical protein
LSIPFIILGKGMMQMDAIVLVIAIVLLLLSIVGQKYISGQYKKI